SGSASHPSTIHHYPSTIHHQSCASKSQAFRRFVSRPYAIREPTAGRIWKRISSIHHPPSVLRFQIAIAHTNRRHSDEYVLCPYESRPYAIREPTIGRIWKRISSIHHPPSVLRFQIAIALTNRRQSDEFVLCPYESRPYAIREPTAGRNWTRISSIHHNLPIRHPPSVLRHLMS